jgi:hypothetical protein
MGGTISILHAQFTEVFSSGLIVSDGARKTCITPVKKADWEAGGCFGDDWIRAGETVALLVPSAAIRG